MSSDTRKRPWAAARAAAILIMFGLFTSFAYIIYESLLGGISAQVHTVNSFIWPIIFLSIGKLNRKSVWIWRNTISWYSVKFALANFAYWYAFWNGLAAMNSAPLAIAFIALTMIVTPMMLWRLEPPEEREPIQRIILTGIVLVVAMVLIKLDLPLADVSNLDKIKTKLPEAYPVLCLLIAVLAEGVMDYTLYSFRPSPSDLKLIKLEYSDILPDLARRIVPDDPSSTLESELAKKARNDISRQALIICLILSIIVLFVHGQIGTGNGLGKIRDFGWYFGWMAVLGIIGASARTIFILPLQSKRLDMGAIPPLMAGRQLIYLAAALAWLYLCDTILASWMRCNHEAKVCSPTFFDGRVIVDLNILPNLNMTYWVGLFIVAIVWIARWREIYIRNGFFLKH